MKQLLFLLLFPCLALAQYTGNAGQKITLGEQTTADGLVYRGLAADTTRKPIVDTMAYILLDTNTNIIWQYKKATNNAWTRVGGSISSGVTGVLPVANGGTGQTNLTPTNYLIKRNSSSIFDTSAIYESGGNVRIGTTANSIDGGFTNTSLYIKQIANGTGGGGLHIEQSDSTNVAYFGFNNNAFRIGTSYRSNGIYKPIEFDANVGVGTNNPNGKFEVFKSSGNNLAINVARFGGNKGYATFNNFGDLIGYYEGTTSFLTAIYTANTVGFGSISNSNLTIVTNDTRRATILSNGNFGIGTLSPGVQFHTTGGVRFATFSGGGSSTLTVDNNGDLARTSSIEIKKDITPINYGLNQILQINPINFNWIDEDKYGNENENGFIAEDVMSIIPNVVGSDIHGLFMDYTKLIPILTKAIQEQQALIKALEQRILILENK